MFDCPRQVVWWSGGQVTFPRKNLEVFILRQECFSNHCGANPKPVNTLISLCHFNWAMTNQIRDQKPQATKLITVTACGFFILDLIGFFPATQ